MSEESDRPKPRHPGAAEPPSVQAILDVAAGFMSAKHLFAASELGLFEALAESPATLEELAPRVTLPQRTLRVVADAMVALGFLERDGTRYRNAPVADAYLAGASDQDLRPFLRFWDRVSYRDWNQFSEVVRSGAPPATAPASPESQRIACEGIGAFTAGAARALTHRYDLAAHRRVLDLGGGIGVFLDAILAHRPALEGTLFERPPVAALAEEHLARFRAAGRLAVVAGDFFRDPLPGGHDLVIVANVLHMYRAERNRALLGRIRAAAAHGTRLALVDLWTDASHTRPLSAALLAGEFLLTCGEGRVYSHGELEAWLVEAGWRPLEHVPLDGPLGLILAEAGPC